MSDKTAIIVAGGTGSRAGGGIPKQFRNLAGKPVIYYSIRAFIEEDPMVKVIVVAHRDFLSWSDRFREEFGPQVITVEGGETRLESVANGLAYVTGGYVAIHDAARPLVTPVMIERGWEAAARHGAVVPATPLSDSLRHLSDLDSNAVRRSEYVAVQTPQIFDARLLKSAYDELRSCDEYILKTLTDDASVAELAGHKVSLYDGMPHNLKITLPEDFLIAETLLKLK